MDSPWQSCQRRERVLAAVILTYIPGVLAIGVPLNELIGSEIPIYVIALAWMLAFAASVIALNFFKCPSCQRPFFHTWLLGNIVARKCMHCGFPKWAEAKHG